MNKQKRIAEVDSTHNNPFIEYISQFRELNRRPSQMSELADGVILIELFSLIKHFKMTENYEENPKSFAHRFSNLKLLLTAVEQFWNESLQCELQGMDIDIVEVAQYSSVSELNKLVQLFVKTAAKSQDNQIFIQNILATAPQTQAFLKNILEQIFNSQLRQSPRKEKEKRMIDRLLQIDHENQKLQQVISTICEEKYQLEVKLKNYAQILTEKNLQLQKMRSYINEDNFTPQKKKYHQIVPDTSDRKDDQIDSLKFQIVEMNGRHEKQIQDYLKQIQKLSYKAENYDKTKAQLQLSQSIILNNQELITEVRKMDKQVSQLKAELIDKENIIELLKEKSQKDDKVFIEMTKNQMTLKGQLERKSVQISQLMTRIQRASPVKLKNGNNLYLQFPDIVNTEAQAYIQTNKALRQYLEKTRLALEKTSAELDKAKEQLNVLSGYDNQNKKLRQLIVEQKTYKGEEIDLLVHALYHLRKKIPQDLKHSQRVLKPKNI